MCSGLCYSDLETRTGYGYVSKCPTRLFYRRFCICGPKWSVEVPIPLPEWRGSHMGTLDIWRVHSNIGSGTIFCHLKKKMMHVSLKLLIMFTSLRFANFKLEACVYRYCRRCLLSCWLYWGFLFDTIDHLWKMRLQFIWKWSQCS